FLQTKQRQYEGARAAAIVKQELSIQKQPLRVLKDCYVLCSPLVFCAFATFGPFGRLHSRYSLISRWLRPGPWKLDDVVDGRTGQVVRPAIINRASPTCNFGKPSWIASYFLSGDPQNHITVA